MKTNHTKRSKQGTKKGVKTKESRRGMALITVLTIMSLATIMIMTFFSLAQNEHKASGMLHNVQKHINNKLVCSTG